MIFLGLLVMIIFFFWPIILGAIILFIIWMCWPEKKWQCSCGKKFYSEKSCINHSENCEVNKRVNKEREESERRQRENRQEQGRSKYRHRWGKNRDSSFYDNPFDDDFWKDDVYGDDQEFWDEQEEFWKDVDPEGFYNRRGDHYHSQKKFKEEQEYWKRQYEEAKREYDRLYEELLGKLNEKDVKKCYKKLGLTTTATFDEVKKKFRILVLKYHPDKCKDKRVGDKKFKEIFEAYETIKKSVMTSNA